MALAAPHAAAATGRHWVAAADPTLSKCVSEVRLACVEAAAMQSRRLCSALCASNPKWCAARGQVAGVTIVPGVWSELRCFF